MKLICWYYKHECTFFCYSSRSKRVKLSRLLPQQASSSWIEPSWAELSELDIRTYHHMPAIHNVHVSEKVMSSYKEYKAVIFKFLGFWIHTSVPDLAWQCITMVFMENYLNLKAHMSSLWWLIKLQNMHILLLFPISIKCRTSLYPL